MTMHDSCDSHGSHVGYYYIPKQTKMTEKWHFKADRGKSGAELG